MLFYQSVSNIDQEKFSHEAGPLEGTLEIDACLLQHSSEASYNEALHCCLQEKIL